MSKRKTIKPQPKSRVGLPTPLTPERKAFLKAKLDEAIKTQPRLAELRTLLLGKAGEEIVARPEPHLELILADGKEKPCVDNTLEAPVVIC